jgi:bifunctional DNA-binding transcriptional regulator/antitoxin component of YhaV-PrlF toxin-antitoxin module
MLRDRESVDFRIRFDESFNCMTTMVDQKGNVPLPEQVLRESGVHPGDQLEVLTEDGNIILRKLITATDESLLDILKSLKGLPIPERNRSSVRDVRL